jgi:hypothetical protein
MDKAAMVLAPTVFERAAPHGIKSALMTAKKDAIAAAHRRHDPPAAEAPGDAEGSNIDWTGRLGPRLISTRLKSITGYSAQPRSCSTKPTPISSIFTPLITRCTWSRLGRNVAVPPGRGRLLGEILDAHPI